MMTMKDMFGNQSPPPTRSVVYYPDEEADKDGPRVDSPRLRCLTKKMKCAREYAARLALLLHARKCTSGDCSLEHCAIAKGVLTHCQECNRASACHPSCREAKILLRHYRRCKTKNKGRPCLVCAILHHEFLPKINKSTTIVYL